MNPIILVILPVAQENTEAQERERAERQQAKEKFDRAMAFFSPELYKMSEPPKREPALGAQTAPQASSSTTQHADASWQDVSEKLTQAVTALRQLVRQSLR